MTDPGLEILDEAPVDEAQIDHLGHMNVRYYHERALRASAALATAHGLGPEACRDLGASFELHDAFTRHYREQLAGEHLVVRGGVLAVRPDGLRLYHELENPSRGERSATYVQEWKLRDAESRALVPLPENVAQSAGGACVPWPEHGRPRTLELDGVPPSPGLDEARRRDLAVRHERVVSPGECDANGRVPASRYQDLVWGGEPIRTRGPHLRPLADGGKLGWATLESRGVLHELPREGTRIQAFGAEVDIAGKTTTHHMWVYDVASGALLCTSSIVNLAFDVTRRRAIEIPEDVREEFQGRFHPDLR